MLASVTRRTASVAAVVLLAAIGPMSAPSTGSPAAPAGHTKPSNPHDRYDDYVALGDSYTAGPLIPEIRADRPFACFVSTNNYPAQLAAYLEVDSYADASCSAADSTHLRNPQQLLDGSLAPPQLDAVTADADLVTLGMGGNDYGLFGEMITECQRVRDQAPNGAPCRELFTVDGVDTKIRDARAIRARIAENIRDIRARAPHARIVVVGYLRILPHRGTCDAVPFARGDYRWGNRVQRALNTSLRTAARTNRALFVDLLPMSKGHDACAGPDAWVNGSVLDGSRAAAFHPFASGMTAVARRIHRILG